MKFKSVQFVTSALKPEEWPVSDLPEVAIVGRSNVGKSSLINHLLQSKTVAKVSSTPGKTQRINYFLIDNTFHLVDLPGYGYAKTSKSLQKEWGQWMETYFLERPLRLVLFLIDSRREGLSLEDAQFLEWAKHHQIPLLVILTKGDKLSKRERDEKSHLLYSVKEGKCREILIRKINEAL
ncbi:MAG: YihA family ribosome biogenesis GTP-binding protein [Chlamydiia bacterium]|nr:YihA family ribosome biogenesis GTP-binding protein [Chlamydiia bacterium]